MIADSTAVSVTTSRPSGCLVLDVEALNAGRLAVGLADDEAFAAALGTTEADVLRLYRMTPGPITRRWVAHVLGVSAGDLWVAP